MAENHIYSLKSVKFGTPTGTATMPSATGLTLLPKTEKGSVVIEESEATDNDFFVDQSPYPIESIPSDAGTWSAVARFNDIQYATLAIFKGGVGDDSGFTPATGWQTIRKALEFETDSGHIVDFYNAACKVRFLGLGGRDKLASMELMAKPLICADGTAPYAIRPV